MFKISKFLLLIIIFNAPTISLALAGPAKVSQSELAVAHGLISIRSTPVGDAERDATISALLGIEEASSPVDSAKGAEEFVAPPIFIKIPAEAIRVPLAGTKRARSKEVSSTTASVSGAGSATVEHKKARIGAGGASADSIAVESRGPRNHNCLVLGCGRIFLYPSELKKHENIHKGLRPYVCKNASKGCGATFPHDSNCRKHERKSCEYRDAR